MVYTNFLNAMRMKPLVCALVVLLGFGGYFLYRFGTSLGWWDPLTRPGEVSASAKYVFIWESSAWFDCSTDAKRDVNVCRAWDSYGRLIATGDFRLEDEKRAASPGELHPSCIGATNAEGLSDEIYLFGPHGLILGRKLVRIRQAKGQGG